MKNKKIALCALLAVHIALPLSLTETAKNSLEIIKKSAHAFNEKRKQYISNKSIAETAMLCLFATQYYLYYNNTDIIDAFLEKHSQATNALLALEGIGILGLLASDLFYQRVDRQEKLSIFEVRILEKIITSISAQRLLKHETLKRALNHPQIVQRCAENPILCKKIIETSAQSNDYTLRFDEHSFKIMQNALQNNLFSKQELQALIQDIIDNRHKTYQKSTITDLLFAYYLETYANEVETIAILKYTLTIMGTEYTRALFSKVTNITATIAQQVMHEIIKSNAGIATYNEPIELIDHILSLFVNCSDPKDHDIVWRTILSEVSTISNYPLTTTALNTKQHKYTIESIPKKYFYGYLNNIDTLLTLLPGYAPEVHAFYAKKSECFTVDIRNGDIENKSFFRSILEIRLHHNLPIRISRQNAIRLDCLDLYSKYTQATAQIIAHLAHPEADTTQSPTKRYIAHHPKRVKHKFENDIANTHLKHLSHELMQLEEQESKQGHYTFVHGEPTHMHAYQHWFTKLCEINYNTSLNNYIFTRFKHTQNNDIIAKQAIKRKKLKQAGNRKMVFMAHNLYSNSAGACAGDYYLRARQQWDYTTKIQDIFSSFGYQDIYNQFADELHALEKEYKELCPLGQLLMFSFSPQALKKCVYTCYPGGRRRSVEIKDAATSTLQSTDNMVKIAQALKNNPDAIEDYESLEFCFIPTLDYGLNPQVAGKDIRVFNLTGVEPAKMEAYLQKEAALTKKIQAAINTQKLVAIQKGNAPALA